MTSSRQPRTSNPASRWWVAAPLVVASALALSACDRTKPGEPANSSAPMTPSPSAPAVPVPQAGSGAANTTGGSNSNSMGTNDSGTGSSMPPASAASDAASMPRSTN